MTLMLSLWKHSHESKSYFGLEVGTRMALKLELRGGKTGCSGLRDWACPISELDSVYLQMNCLAWLS